MNEDIKNLRKYIDIEFSIIQIILKVIILLIITNTIGIVICWILIIGNIINIFKLANKLPKNYTKN